jgi:hypothetical protein
MCLSEMSKEAHLMLSFSIFFIYVLSSRCSEVFDLNLDCYIRRQCICVLVRRSEAA